ncbi:hypothetical protein [Flavobacterium ginsengiterrae]
MKHVFYCFMIIVLSSCGRYIKNSDNRTEKFFVSWNIATANSIQLQENFTNDDYQKSLYQNRLQAFKAYIDIVNLNELNTKSIRYKLINQYLNDWNNKFYIVEANESGEVSTKISYVILQNSRDSSKVLKYIYKNGKWEKVEQYELSPAFKFHRENFITEYGVGKNENDITVTFIEDNNIISSDFFLNFTMKQIDIFNK